MSLPFSARFTQLAIKPHLPRRTVRLRLALLYGCVFIACGAALLAITYGLVAAYGSSTSRLPNPPRGSFPPGNFSDKAGQHAVADFQHAADLHTLVLMSVLALAIMAAVSIWLGWLIAGRVLSPLRTITSAARDISATSLHQRLALDGPDDELKELADTFDGLLGRLEASFQSQRRFVANASHELRTPLARLKTLTQVALADPDANPASLRSAHEGVLASEMQLERLIDALLTLASGEQPIDKHEPVDLAAVTRKALQARAPEIERSELRLTNKLDHAWTKGNRQLVERLVTNLVENAIRHNETRGWIRLESETKSGTAILSVANSGAVISPEDLERLKQPFQRLAVDRTTSHSDGHGLGLSIVAAVVAAHGGTLELHALSEGGMRIQVELPCATPPRTTPIQPAALRV
ncbi:MAG: sensor histidine kinase [Solirubrobacteraceae bacterium]